MLGTGGESLPPMSEIYARRPSVENAAVAGLSCRRLLSLRSPFRRSTIRKSDSPGLPLKTQAVRPFGASDMLATGMFSSRDDALPVVESTSVSFWSV